MAGRLEAGGSEASALPLHHDRRSLAIRGERVWQGSFQAWAALAREDPVAAGERLLETVAWLVSRMAGRGSSPQDLISEVVLRAWSCFLSPRRWPAGDLIPWLWGVAKRVSSEWRRSEERMVLHLLEGEVHTLQEGSLLEQTEECRAALRAFVRLTETLPPPSGEILWLQRVRLWNRSEIIAFLQEWRPEISPNTARGCIREAHKRLRAAWPDKDPRSLWPQAFSRKNPWILTPPILSLQG